MTLYGIANAAETLICPYYGQIELAISFHTLRKGIDFMFAFIGFLAFIGVIFFFSAIPGKNATQAEKDALGCVQAIVVIFILGLIASAYQSANYILTGQR